MFNFDEENIFAGDADIEQQQLIQAGNRIAALREQGICLHGWLNTRTLVCLEPDCGKTWDNKDEMDDEIAELNMEYGI
jgi:hypothetical protein